MITVDGKDCGVLIADFDNFEEILLHIKDLDVLSGRIITDIILNDKAFTEIYPHQSEDIASNTINTIGIVTVSIEQMIVDIVAEMYKVVELIKKGSKEVADLCRSGEEARGLEILQDLLDVIRDFRAMQSSLEISLSGVDMTFESNDAQLNDLLGEMNDVLANEDWILLSDLFEYEFIPFCDKWKEEVDVLRSKLEG